MNNEGNGRFIIDATPYYRAMGWNKNGDPEEDTTSSSEDVEFIDRSEIITVLCDGLVDMYQQERKFTDFEDVGYYFLYVFKQEKILQLEKKLQNCKLKKN